MLKADPLDQDFDQDRFDALIPELRPAPEIHPLSAQDFDEHKIKFVHSESVEMLSYHELAWEFLRRNRFYQALCDKADGYLDDADWGYRWHLNAPRSHGLVRLKPFRERYEENSPPAWAGLDGFAEQLPLTPATNFEKVSVELKPGQVIVVFDISGIVGGHCPWSAQSDAAREHLEMLRAAQCAGPDFFGKPRHKNVLIRQLQMFDLLSQGLPMASAVLELDSPISAATKKRVRGRNHAVYMQREQAAVTSTAFDDATEAYRLVYRHGYLSLVSGERYYTLHGQNLIPITTFYSGLEDEDEANMTEGSNRS